MISSVRATVASGVGTAPRSSLRRSVTAAAGESRSVTIVDLVREAGRSIVFHYTNVQLGEWIVEDQLFATGVGAAYGTGLERLDVG
jgi:hypothetical protein